MIGFRSSPTREGTRSGNSVEGAISRLALFAIVIVLLSGVHGCIWTEGLWYEDDDLPGEYAVWAVDERSNAAIVEKKDGGLGDSVVPNMVFAYGWNDDFIIAKQHPHHATESHRIDTSITHWYLIELRTKTIHGPLTEDAFHELRKELTVPAGLSFTKTVPRDS